MWQFYQLVQYHYNRLNDANTTDTTNNSKNGIIRINNNSQFVTLYEHEADGSMKILVDRHLLSGTDWQTDQTVSYQGETYYRVSTNEWARSSDCTVIKAIPK